MRNEAEITGQLAAAHRRVVSGRTAHPDATYEDGVDIALKWTLGQSDDVPIDDEVEGLGGLVAARRHLEPERIAVLRCATRVSNPVLIDCLEVVARDWPIGDVRHFLRFYMEQRTARAALMAIAAGKSSDKVCAALVKTAVEAPLEEVNDVLQTVKPG